MDIIRNYFDGKEVCIKINCPFCNRESFVIASEIGFDNWQNGKLIQNALPDLAPTERETLISGLCSFCQDTIF
nr:MAG TPA: PROTEIN/RNA Complex ribosomal subunit, ribonucleoprotein, ribosomal [Caudoviricetes sp.]